MCKSWILTETNTTGLCDQAQWENLHKKYDVVYKGAKFLSKQKRGVNSKNVKWRNCPSFSVIVTRSCSSSPPSNTESIPTPFLHLFVSNSPTRSRKIWRDTELDMAVLLGSELAVLSTFSQTCSGGPDLGVGFPEWNWSQKRRRESWFEVRCRLLGADWRYGVNSVVSLCSDYLPDFLRSFYLCWMISVGSQPLRSFWQIFR